MQGKTLPFFWGRRTADVAAHLVDRVMPQAPYRQWVLTFPWEMRFLLAVDRKFLTQMLRTFLRTIFAWQRLRGRQTGIKDGQPGSIACVQRFGGILNLNPHVHAILPDGLFVEDPGGGERLVFKRLPPPTDEDILRLTVRLAQRLTKIAKRRMQQAEFDPPWDDEQALVHDSAAKALRIPPSELLQGPAQHAWAQDKPLCAKVDGFSLHAARTVDEHDRKGLERLCRYCLRSPLSLERLSIDPDGRVRYRLHRPWPNPAGRTAIVLEPLAFLRRLAALIPAPYTNLIRYHGVFANRSRFRKRLPLPPEAARDREKDEDDGAEVQTDGMEGCGATRPRRLGWAQLLKRVLDVDALECPKCHTPMVVLAFLTDPAVLYKILDHLKLPSSPPATAPARPVPHEGEMFSEGGPEDAGFNGVRDRAFGSAVARAPP